MKTLYTSNGARQVHLGAIERQTQDPRDAAFRLHVPKGVLTPLPPSVDNRSKCSPIQDQGTLGSCTAHSIAGAVESNEKRTQRNLPWWMRIFGVSPVTPLIRISRLFQYYASRLLDNTTALDMGSTLRNSIKAAANFGVVAETLWPYVEDKFATNPPSSAWKEARSHRVTSYHAIKDGDLATMKAALAAKNLICFGFTVYDAMLSSDMSKTGLLCSPPARRTSSGRACRLSGRV